MCYRVLLTLSIVLWAFPAGAIVIPKELGDADVVLANPDYYVATKIPFTGPRTVTLPRASRSCIVSTATALCPANVLEITDLANIVGATNTLSIAPQPGDTINGSAVPLVLNAPGASVLLRPLSGDRWVTISRSSGGGPAGDSDLINVKAFGAVGNTMVLGDGQMTAGSNVLVSGTAAFTSADIGKSIVVDYAGAGTGWTAAPLVSTITGFTDAHTVTLANNAINGVPFYFYNALIPFGKGNGATATSYRPGDTITDGNMTGIVDSTQVAYAYFVGGTNSGGSGGVSSNGQTTGPCTVQGRTGSGYPAFPAAYNAGTTYAKGARVTGPDGFIYYSYVNSNLGNPVTSTAHWVQVPIPFPTTWISTTTYYQGQLVTGSDGLTYVALASNNTNHNPTVAANIGVWWNPAGMPTAFTATFDLTSGAITGPAFAVGYTSPATIGNIGSYISNPTNIANEPVVPIAGCTGLTGATVTITTIPQIIRPTNGGKYGFTGPAFTPPSPNPCGPDTLWVSTTTYALGRIVVGSNGTPYTSLANGNVGHDPVSSPAFWTASAYGCTTSGTGTGIAVRSERVLAGAFEYGTRDTNAFTAAFTASNSINVAGGSSCVWVPPGKYWIDAPLPMFTSPGCVFGNSQGQSELIAPPSTFTGDLMSWSGSSNAAQIPAGPPSQLLNDISFIFGIGGKKTGGLPGARISDLKISASRTSTTNQNAIVFYDQIGNSIVQNLLVQGFNGYCWASGLNKLTTFGQHGESDFSNLIMYGCGNLTHPAVFIDTQGTAQPSNNLKIYKWDIYAPYGHGMWLGSSNQFSANNEFNHLRIEGNQYGQTLFQPGEADLLKIGDWGDANRQADFNCSNCVLTSPYLNNYALSLQSGNTLVPTNIEWSGYMGGNAGYGQGVYLGHGNFVQIKMMKFVTFGCDLFLASTFGTATIWSPGAYEKNYVMCVASTPSRLSSMVNSWSIPQLNCQVLTTSALPVTFGNSCSGIGSLVMGGSGGTDRGRTGNVVTAGAPMFSAPSQSTTTVLQCATQGTPPCQLIADWITAAPSTSLPTSRNCVNIPSNTSFRVIVDLQVKDLNTPANYYTATWNQAHVLSRGVGVGTTLLDGAAAAIAPDSFKTNGANIGTATIAPDTVNGCLKIVHTPGGANFNTLVATALVTTVE